MSDLSEIADRVDANVQDAIWKSSVMNDYGTYLAVRSLADALTYISAALRDMAKDG